MDGYENSTFVRGLEVLGADGDHGGLLLHRVNVLHDPAGDQVLPLVVVELALLEVGVYILAKAQFFSPSRSRNSSVFYYYFLYILTWF